MQVRCAGALRLVRWVAGQQPDVERSVGGGEGHVDHPDLLRIVLESELLQNLKTHST